MIIRLDELEDGLHTLTWAGPIEGVDLLYPEVVTNAKVSANVHKLRNVTTIHAQLSGQLERPCDRTLEPVRLVLDTVMHIVANQRPGTTEASTEMADDDFVIDLPPEQTDLDLTGPIRESLVVEMPMFVHKVGTAPVSYVDERPQDADDDDDDDIDPRWAGLKSVQF